MFNIFVNISFSFFKKIKMQSFFLFQVLIGIYHGAVLGGGGGEVPRANIRMGRRGVASDMAFIFTAYTSMAVVVGEY